MFAMILILSIFSWFITHVSFPFHTEFNKVCALEIIGNSTLAGMTPATQNDKDAITRLSVLTMCRPNTMQYSITASD
jgi:hypothetical protein